jgi:SAM-dependent methyltransferase
LDIDSERLAFATQQPDGTTYITGDGHTLPFPNASFDVVVCHYVLLWLSKPTLGVREMARVTRAGGYVIACAEPDYGGRIDHPPELTALGQCQTESLRQQGAEPEIGRRLGELFTTAELQTQIGVLGGQWHIPAQVDAGFEAEWIMRTHDLAGVYSSEELHRLQTIDRRALEKGRHLLFVPTFYAIGRRTN